MDLLFTLAHWHGLAKLRMHTDETLEVMDGVTSLLGELLREFQKTTCSSYNTRELAKETEARKRRQAKQQARNKGISGSFATAGDGTDDSRRPKTLNLQTYKLHSLGDYTATIRKYGTTDSYSTEPVSVHPN